MAVSDSKLSKSANYFRCVGTLSESSLIKEDCDITVFGLNGAKKKVRGERVRGNLAIETDSGIHNFNVFAQSLTSKGEPNKLWKMYCDMLEWNPAIDGNREQDPSYVNVEGSVSINDYINKSGEVSTNLRWKVFRGDTTRISPDEPSGTTLKATAFIQAIAPEIRNEQETGRLKVTLYATEFNGTCFPIETFVEADMAQDFEGVYEVGQTVPFEIELNSRHIGGAKPQERKFGHAAKVSVNSGFDVQELIIVGGDNEIEQPENLTTEDENGNIVEVKTDWINPVALKKAIKVREQMLAELLTERKPVQSVAERKKAFAKAPKTATNDNWFSDDIGDEEVPF